MKILIVYYETFRRQRQTTHEHLYSFQKYSSADCYYLNVYHKIPEFIQDLHFDLVIYHYTITALKWAGAQAFYHFLDEISILKQISGIKIAIPQDEYVESIAICTFFETFGITGVFTCLTEDDWETVYPRAHSGVEFFQTVLPGYVEPNSHYNTVLKPFHARQIDIGYRARNLPYWLGEHALLKSRIATAFLTHLQGQNLQYDISIDPKDVLLGNRWPTFLANCKCVLGSEGGASLHDPDGSIRQAVEDYMQTHPHAPFEEVRNQCFKDQDHSIQLFSISPRHFESAFFKNCQILVEGHYNGILVPDRDYIPIKKDFSNIPEVLEKLRDREYCNQIITSAYTHLIQSGKYTYRHFVQQVISTSLLHHSLPQESIPTNASAPPPNRAYHILSQGARSYAPLSYAKSMLLRKIYTYADNTGILKFYRKLREQI